MQALARAWLVEADSTEGETRESALENAETSIRTGLAYYPTLGNKPTAYYTPEVAYHSKLFYYSGELQKKRGISAKERLKSYRRAYEIKPDSPLNQMSLVKTYYELAQTATTSEGQQSYALAALDYFVEYAKATTRDPSQRSEYRTLLRTNFDRFPFLAERLHQLEEELFP